MTSDDILYVIQVLLGVDDIYSPTSFDMLMKGLSNPRKGDRRYGKWIPSVINTDRGDQPGLHWLFSLSHHVVPPTAKIVESLTHTRLSSGVKSAFEEMGIATTLHVTGVQHDAYRCGLIALFRQSSAYLMLKQGVDVSQLTEWPNPPPAFDDLVWLFLETRDAQLCDDSEGPTALSEIGVTELFWKVLESGLLDVNAFKKVIRPYIANLRSSSSSRGKVAPSSPSSVTVPCLSPVIVSPASRPPTPVISSSSSPLSYAVFAPFGPNRDITGALGTRTLFNGVKHLSGETGKVGMGVVVKGDDGKPISGYMLAVDACDKGKKDQQYLVTPDLSISRLRAPPVNLIVPNH
jgi:hypothetical protein